MSQEKILKIVRVVLIVIPIIFFVWLAAQDLVVDGGLEAEYSFEELSPFVLTLAPKARISEIKFEDGEVFQSLHDDPVYFDVRLPRAFRSVTFWVKYRSSEEEIIRLGSFANKDEWSFEIKDFEEINELDDNWKEGKVTFSLEGKRFAFQKYQFMISLPEIKNSGREVQIANIKMLAQREALTWQSFWQKLGRKFFSYE